VVAFFERAARLLQARATTAQAAAHQPVSLICTRERAILDLYEALAKESKKDKLFTIVCHHYFGNSTLPELQLTFNGLVVEEGNTQAVRCPFDCLSRTAWTCWFPSKRNFVNLFNHLRENHAKEAAAIDAQATDVPQPVAGKRPATQTTLMECVASRGLKTARAITPAAAAAPPASAVINVDSPPAAVDQQRF